MNSAQRVLKRLGSYSEKTGWIFPHGSNSQVKATVDQLKVLTTDGPLSGHEPPAVIVFRNGTFNLRTNKLEPHNPDHGATYGVAADYIAGSDCPPELDAVIEKCYPPGSKPITRAYIRWLIDPTIRYGEAFLFQGPSGTGKGLEIDFGRSLFPPSVISQALHPADLSSPEKIHQYVVGRRLVAFPDTPAIYEGNCNNFYELVENKPVTTRKLFAGESEESRSLHCRFVIGSVKPLQFKDGRDGYLRRVITLRTLPRDGDPDTTLRDALNPKGARFDAIRAEAISWALAMPLDEVNAVLDRNDPEGLLRDSANDAAVASDTVSQWADACLVPTQNPNTPVTDEDWDVMFECYMGWCDYNNVRFTSQRNNFLGQVRSILGPRRCLPRGREAITRRNLPRLDAGFKLREDILSQHSFPDPRPTRHRFNPSKLGCDGLSKIAELAQAVRGPTVSGHVSAPAQDLSQGYARPQNHCAATELPKSVNLSQDTSPVSLKQEEVSTKREVRRCSFSSSSSSPVNTEEEVPSVLSSPETGPGSLQRNVSRAGRCPETGPEPRHQAPQGLNSAPRLKWHARAVELRASGQHFNSIANQLRIELGVRINGADVRREIG